MTSDFIPKRPHKKSRGGCKTCKIRKVKCDEIRPICSFCDKRGLDCVYVERTTKSGPSSSKLRASSGAPGVFTPPEDDDIDEMILSNDFQLTRTPSPVFINVNSGMSPIDLRMMHFWTTVTAQDIAVGEVARTTMQRAIPQLAFDHKFLLNGMLGIASLNLQKISPSPETRTQTDLYRAKALKGFREALMYVKAGTDEFEAALIMSLLIVILLTNVDADNDDLVVVSWFVLYRGLSSIITTNEDDFDRIRALGSGKIFRREFEPLKSAPVVPNILLDLLRMEPWDPDFPLLESYCQVLDAMGQLYASLKDDGLTGNLFVRVVSWPTWCNQVFADQGQAKSPRALIIMAHFLLFVKFARSVWWFDGVAEKEILKIAAIVGPEWARFMEIPLIALTMDNDKAIAEMMLSGSPESENKFLEASTTEADFQPTFFDNTC